MNLTHVRSFVAVVDLGSFRAAAEYLEISQPAVSHHIRKLEEDLDTALLVRGGAGCLPTQQAAPFVPLARSMLAVAQRARDSLTSPELIIGASSNIGIYVLQPVFKRFLDQSLVAGRLEIDTNPAIVARLKSGEIDVAAVEWWNDEVDFHEEVLKEEDLVLVVGPEHRWAGRTWVEPRALLEEDILGGESGTGTGRVLKEGLGSLADGLRITRTLGSTEAVKEGVKAGLGVSLVMRSAVEEEIGAGSLHLVKLRGVQLRKTIYLVRRDADGEESAAAEFCRLALDGL